MPTHPHVEEQLNLLVAQGLQVEHRRSALHFLTRINPQRFAIYARYFRVPSEVGDSRRDRRRPFLANVSFSDIQRVYEQDEALRVDLALPLAQVELLLRAHLAAVMTSEYGAYGAYVDRRFYADRPEHKGTVDAFLRDVARNMDRNLLDYWHEPDEMIRQLRRVPISQAVEALTFGTLAAVIERGDRGALSAKVASSIGVAKRGFASRVKALVYLRNRCAHHTQLWNHFVIDAGATPNNVRSKVRKVAGDFEPRSIMDVLASMEDMLLRAHCAPPFLPDLAETYRPDDVFWSGLCVPRKVPGVRPAEAPHSQDLAGEPKPE